MEFRWRATIGAVASRLLTATGARILNELIQSNQSLDEIINQGRPEGKKIDVPVDVSGPCMLDLRAAAAWSEVGGIFSEGHTVRLLQANGRPLTKKEAIRKCFEDLSNFIHDDDDLRIREERQYVYEYFRPNVRNVILEGLSREEKETTDRLKNFLKMVLDADNASKQQGGILGALLNKSSKGSAVSRTKSAETTVQVDDDSDEDDAAQIAPSDAEPLLSRVAE